VSDEQAGVGDVVLPCLAYIDPRLADIPHTRFNPYGILPRPLQPSLYSFTSPQQFVMMHAQLPFNVPPSKQSTSGILIVIPSEGSVFPLYWTSRKQSSTARSTPEAEMIAMSTAVFSEAFSVQTILEHLLQRSVRVTYKQDNLGVVQISESGYSVKLRHAPRVHRVNVSSVQVCAYDRIYTQTSEQIANGLTKVIAPIEWPKMLTQLCVEDFVEDRTQSK